MSSSYLIGIAAVLGALVVALATALVHVARRSSRQGEQAEEEGRRARALAEIQGSINLDDVLSRTLEGAVAVTSADAALVRLTPRGGEEAPLVASIGVTADGADAVAGPPDSSPPTIVQVSYSYPEPEEGQIHRSLAAPLVSVAGAIGTLYVYTRDPDRRFDADEGRRLAELAAGASTAIENARQFREARQLADLDALTGLHNRRYFHETLSRECSRAHRYTRRLALIVFDLDDFKSVNDRIGHLSGDAALAETAERVRSVVRAADIPCRVGGDEFAIVMPESGLEQAGQLFHRLQDVISGRPIGTAGRLSISAGVAELKPDDDSVSLFERADQALYRAKRAGKGRAFTADGHAA